MKIKISIFIGFFSMLVSLSGISQAGEIDDRIKIWNEVTELFGTGKFSELETMANKFRASKARTSSGIWKLTLFYSGLSPCLAYEKDDKVVWSKIEENVRKWQLQYPDSSMAHLAYAQMLINHGWVIRGSDYAYQVKQKNWKPFHEYIESARVYLEKHKKVALTDPYWYELMEIIATAQSWPEQRMESMLAEGLSHEPLFYELYFGAVNYYLPKWNGSVYAIEKFARKAQENTKASEGFGMYARIYWYVSQTQYRDDLFSESLVDWLKMKKGIDDVLKRYPDDWNVNNFAKFACLAKDKEKTASLIAMIKGSPMPNVWGKQNFFENCKHWSYSL